MSFYEYGVCILLFTVARVCIYILYFPHSALHTHTTYTHTHHLHTLSLTLVRIGVVDSEDLPLSISREKPQDSRLLGKIQLALVKKVLKFLNEKAAKEPEEYRYELV